MKKGKSQTVKTSEEYRNPNRIREGAEFSKLIEKLGMDDLEELREIVFKAFDEDYKEGEAVLDWLLRSAPNYKMMQTRMVVIIRSYFLMGRGDLKEGKTSAEFLKERKQDAN